MKNLNLSLTKYNDTDFELYTTMVYDDTVMKYITGKALTNEMARKKFDSILAINDEDENLGYFKVYNADKCYIGDCKLVWYKKDSTLLEIGYMLKPAYWHQGYGTQICTLLLEQAERYFKGINIIGIIDPENTASKKLLAKFQFKSVFIGKEDDMDTEKLLLLR